MDKNLIYIIIGGSILVFAIITLTVCCCCKKKKADPYLYKQYSLNSEKDVNLDEEEKDETPMYQKRNSSDDIIQ